MEIVNIHHSPKPQLLEHSARVELPDCRKLTSDELRVRTLAYAP